MNLLRILVIAILGLTAAPSYAALVLVTLEGEPFTEWEFAQRDGGGTITSYNVADADGDGIASFFVETVPETSVGVHITSGGAKCMFVKIRNISALSPISETTVIIPFFQSVAGDSLIVEALGKSSGMFSLGQPATVIDGATSGLDGLVLENLGVSTAADLLAIDVPLPTFTGDAQVVGLFSLQVIPEPSTAALALSAGLILCGVRCRRP